MSLFNELKRRNVIRVATAYLVVGWLLIQILGIATDSFEAPSWVMKLVITVIVIGFFISLIISWVYELTPEGIKKEKDIISDDSITSHAGKKLDYITIAAALAVAGMIAWQQMSPTELDSRGEIEMENDKIITEKNSVIPAQAGIQSLDLETNNKSIAVLPFENRSPDPNDAYFTDGIHDDLLTYISKIGAIKTISRTSVMQYKNTTKTIGQIGKELNVATVLEGGVQRAGNRVRINVQLIDAKTDDHLWAQIYNRELNMDNVFEIQTEIAEEIAKALKAQLTPQEQDILSTRPTQNLEAYEAYLLGKQRMKNRQAKTLEEAVLLFKKAIKLDEKFALAYVGLADSYMLQIGYSGTDQTTSMEIAQKTLNQALKLNDKLGEAYTTLGFLKTQQNDYDGAIVELEKALILSPNYPTLYLRYGAVLSRTGNYEKVLEMLYKGLQLDPLSITININISYAYSAMGEFDKALKQGLKTLNLDPNNPNSHQTLSWLYVTHTNQLDKGVFWSNKTLRNYHEKDGIYYRLVLAYLEMGDDVSALKTLEHMHDNATNKPLEYELQLIVAFYQGDEKKQRKYLNLMLQINPEDVSQKWILRSIDTQAGHHDKVLVEFMDDYPQLFITPVKLSSLEVKWMAINLAWVYQQASQDDKATQLLGALLNSYSDKEKADIKNRVLMMQIYSLQGNVKGFTRLFKDSILHPYRVDAGNSWFIQYRYPTYKAMMQEPEFLKLKIQADQLMADARARLEKHNQNEDDK